MPPKAPRKEYQRGEQVLQVDDPGNHAFKAQPVKNGRKRSNTSQASNKNDPVEINSDNEHPQPSKKPRPGMLQILTMLIYAFGSQSLISE